MENNERIEELKKKIPSKKKITTVIILVVAVIIFFTGLYTVEPEEVGVIQRFGKFNSTTNSGLHFKIPFGVDKLTKVKVKHVYKAEFGFRTLQAGVQTKFSHGDYTSESLMLTGDLNIANVEWIVQFRIRDARKFLFNVRNGENNIRDISEAVMRLVVGDHSVDEVIVLNRKDIAYDAQIKIQNKLDEYNTGIEIVTVNLQNVNPPDKVKPAFNNVNSAKQEQEKIVNQAWQQYNKVIPEAKGKAKQVIEEASGYALKRTNRAEGDANRFIKVYNKYRLAKTVTKRRMYIETMSEILPELENIYIVDEDQGNVLPLLNLQKGGK
ncbi:MAG: FtsH protease activity modulator HflK [Candidatus Cloacimonadota bacterium]|nr:FtsH protease activity modulator HflK [Candidatus Cloacimonadota bacterium]